jgi:Uma2 family endonuclease
MATLPRLTEEEYLHTSFPDLDREFRDGEVVGRALPDWFHSRSQSKFDRFFGNREDTLNIQVGAELRVRLRPGRHVIPDVAVFWPAEPEGSVPDRLPLIAIEILSEPERMSKVPDKLDEYAKWGVPHIWLVDPRRKIFYVFKDGLTEVRAFIVAELSLTVTPAEIFG